MKRIFLLSVLGGLVGLGWGCATARLVGPGPSVLAPQAGAPSVSVVIEPFFENAQWKVSTEARMATVYPGSSGYGGMGYGGYDPRYGGGAAYGPYGGGLPQDVTYYQQVASKPVYARPQVLAQEQAQVVAEVQRLRPNWRVYSTSALQQLQGPVTLVRVVVGELELLGSNRPAKRLAFIFGFICPPLWLFDIGPVRETQRVNGMLFRYQAESTVLKAKLLRYATQPDFAVDTRGLVPRQQPVAMDIEYQEGLFASDASREPVVVRGFTDRLAAATVALVEGVR